MRGTSKREDAAFWILRLDEVSGADDYRGAKYVTRFVKNRNAPDDPVPLEWDIRPDGNRVLVTYHEADNLVLFRKWIEDGLETCSEIAEEMGLSKGQVSKLAKKAEKAGWLKKTGPKISTARNLKWRNEGNEKSGFVSNLRTISFPHCFQILPGGNEKP